MATIEWRVRADEFGSCNCSYGCPCQFNALPTHRFCEGFFGYKISEGHFGDVRLDGLNVALVVHCPGALHEGNCTTQLIIDERADPRQREALMKIMRGEDRGNGHDLVGAFGDVSAQARASVRAHRF